MSAPLELCDVSKQFGRQRALDRVSLVVPPGVVFALLGENGAGKTTAIRILLGLVRADRGEARVLGLDSRQDAQAIRRRVGYVAERPTLYDWMTVSEIGWFAAGFYGPSYLPRYDALARGFLLPADRKIKSLSKGMRSKVALTLAMAHEPELLVLDEPTSGLDTLVRREFLESMVDWAAQGRTVLLSSHQIVEVDRVADMVGILHAGRLVAIERLDELKADSHDILVTLDDAGSAPHPPEQFFSVGRRLLCQRRVGRQWQLIVRGELNGQVQWLREQPGVAAVEVRKPGLEEIFVAYLRGDAPPATPSEEAAS